jgi:hypothetical protein
LAGHFKTITRIRITPKIKIFKLLSRDITEEFPNRTTGKTVENKVESVEQEWQQEQCERTLSRRRQK